MPSTATPIAWSQESGGLEEIVVTATRREQNLQDVPLAVVAYTGEMLERQGIENMEDLKAVVPNLVVAGNLGGTDTASFTIRGIPNVGTYIDGIWQVSNNGLLLREFVDLERVEVLRGPQGTLYGRDSTGGAIRLYTRPPDEEFGVDVDMTVGNLDRRDLKASLDLPFTETFRSRFTVAQYDRDGYITSLTTGQKSGAFEDEALKADFIWEPSDRFSVRFNAQEDEIVNTQARVNTYIDNQIGWNSGYQAGLSLAYDLASNGKWNCNYTCSGFPGGQLDEWEGRQDTTVPSRQSLEQQMVDVKVGITDNVSFQYLLGHTYSDTRQYNDWDAGEFNFYIDYFLNELDLTSHEFQFAGGTDRFSWVGGVYAWDQEGRGRNPAYSMADWVEATPNYPNDTPVFSYANQVTPNAACTTATPASRGITSWQPHVAAGYVPPFALGLDVNSVNGWPFGCNFIPNGWVTALGRRRPAAGRRPVERRRDRRNGHLRRGHHRRDRELRRDDRLPLARPDVAAVPVRRRRRRRCGRDGGQAAGPEPGVCVGQHLRGHPDPDLRPRGRASTRTRTAWPAAGSSRTTSCCTWATRRASTRAVSRFTRIAWDPSNRSTTPS